MQSCSINIEWWIQDLPQGRRKPAGANHIFCQFSQKMSYTIERHFAFHSGGGGCGPLHELTVISYKPFNWVANLSPLFIVNMTLKNRWSSNEVLLFVYSARNITLVHTHTPCMLSNVLLHSHKLVVWLSLVQVALRN